MATTEETLYQAALYRQQGALQLAEQLCQQVLQQQPQHPEALNHLGMIAYDAGNAQRAAQCLEQATALRPDVALYQCRLGMAYSALGRLNDAVARYEKAVRLQPAYAAAHLNLGNAYQRLNRLRDSTASYEQAAHCQPQSAEIWNNLGVAYHEENRFDEALASFDRALQLQPGFAGAHNNKGMALDAQGKLDEAAASYRQAIALRPNLAQAYNNLAAVLLQQARPEEALTHLDQALQLQPNYPNVHLTRAMVLLLLGRFEEGWLEYEWRRLIPTFTAPPLPGSQRAWDRSSLQGRTILLRAEQSLSDTLQFVRYARLIQEKGARVIVEAQPQLLRLLRSCAGIDQLVARGELLPDFDVHAFLMSLPGLLGTNQSNIPADVPYLAADRDLASRWRREMGILSGLKVGIVWQGNPGPRPDYLRSVGLKEFAPLARVQGVYLFSLQAGIGGEQLAGAHFPVSDLGSRFNLDSFDDAAAALSNLDLLVTVDTALAHLGGALGMPVWVVLPVSPDWRWMLGREDSPWYPSLRLFRQQQRGQWTDVFERIRLELHAFRKKT